MHYEKTLGIPLLRRNFKERHALLMIFTDTKGLIPVVGYGLSNFGSRRASHLDIMNLCELEITHRRGMWAIHSGKSVAAHFHLKNNLEKSHVAMAQAARLVKFLPVEVPHEKVFSLFREFLQILESTDGWTNLSLQLFSLIFQSKLLFLLGHFPALSESLCHSPSEAKVYYFAHDPFRIQCEKCAHFGGKKQGKLPTAVIQLLINMEQQTLSKIVSSKLPDEILEPLRQLAGHFDPS